MMKQSLIEIIQPDDWHVHLRQGEILNVVSQYSSRINNRCIIMPNLEIPITTSYLATKYKNEVKKTFRSNSFIPLIPCFLNETLDLKDFENALKNEVFIGAKLYPVNSTTNSSFGVTEIEKIYPALEILEKLNKNLLVHAEKVEKNISLFDREQYFIDDELTKIIIKFPKLKVVLEHISSKYGADFVSENKNMAGTITPQHMLITKKDVFFEDDVINPHHFCMPIVKDEKDLIALRKYACSGNSKFFLGTDSAPHHIKNQTSNLSSKPGIFSSPCSIELYTEIFDQENSLNMLETFASINGPNFYNLPINNNKIRIVNQKWTLDEFTIFNQVKIKNFYGGKELNWKVL